MGQWYKQIFNDLCLVACDQDNGEVCQTCRQLIRLIEEANREEHTHPPSRPKDQESSYPGHRRVTREPNSNEDASRRLFRETDKSSLRGNLSTASPNPRPETNRVASRQNVSQPSYRYLESKLDATKRSSRALPTKKSSKSASRSKNETSKPETPRIGLPDEDQEKYRKQAETYVKIHGLKRCPGGLNWTRYRYGYRCIGRGHFISDELLAEGKGGYYKGFRAHSVTGEEIPAHGPFYGPDPHIKILTPKMLAQWRLQCFNTNDPEPKDALWSWGIKNPDQRHDCMFFQHFL